MNAFATMVRREYIENRGGFVWTPAIVCGFLLITVAYLMIFLPGQLDGFEGTADGPTTLGAMLDLLAAEDGLKQDVAVGAFLSTMLVPTVLLPIVIFFYFLGSLYEERRDRSILFWKSMPVSDTMEVGSKLVAGLVLVQACFLGIIVIAQLASLIIATVVGGLQGGSVGVLWQLDMIFAGWVMSVLTAIFYALWALPVFGWVMLASSYAPRAPLMFAVVPPAAVALLEGILFKSSHFVKWIGSHISGLPMFEPFVEGFENGHGGAGIDRDVNITEEQVMELIANPDFGLFLSGLGQLDLWLGVAIGLALSYGAIWIRRFSM